MKIIYNPQYRELMVKQLKEQFLFFLKNNIDFSITVNNMDDGIKFNPPLPDEIMQSFNDFIFFTLSGYTFKSAYVENDTLIFEAGFGAENIGAMVYVDIDRVIQIVMSETPIFINVTASVARVQKKDSFEVFASKNKNKKFFKKRDENN